MSLFKILHRLTNSEGKFTSSIALHFSFLHTLSYAAWKSVNRWHSVPDIFLMFVSQLKFDQQLIIPFQRLLNILLLFLQHKVLILHMKCLQELYIVYCICCTQPCDFFKIITHHICPLSYEMNTLLLMQYDLYLPYCYSYSMISSSHIATHTVWSLPPILLLKQYDLFLPYFYMCP
jgi:hypothetical protein